MDGIKEIVVLSGKGGAGKTTFTASIAKLLSGKVIADTDVDASDMYILMNPRIHKRVSFHGGKSAIIQGDKCILCGKCADLCRFDAIHLEQEEYRVSDFKCEGCGLCVQACPVEAIDLIPQEAGEWFISDTDHGPMVHARLNPGSENSGHLVTMVKHQGRELAKKKGLSLILIDGPPGIGCPVTSSLSGADLVIMVAEPSLSSLHDIQRLHEIVRHFNIPSLMLINKSDMNGEIHSKLVDFATSAKIPLIGSIPLSREIMDLQLKCLTPVDGTGAMRDLFIGLFGELNRLLEEILS